MNVWRRQRDIWRGLRREAELVSVKDEDGKEVCIVVVWRRVYERRRKLLRRESRWVSSATVGMVLMVVRWWFVGCFTFWIRRWKVLLVMDPLLHCHFLFSFFLFLHSDEWTNPFQVQLMPFFDWFYGELFLETQTMAEVVSGVWWRWKNGFAGEGLERERVW